MDTKTKRELHRKKMREEGKYSKRKTKKRKKKKKGSVLSTIVLIAATCVFVFSAYQLYGIFSSYKKGDDEYKKIENIAITQEKQENGGEKTIVDFDSLKKINPDVIAWIKFDEPKVINYPVVHSKDNNEYLTKLFGEGKNTYGTLFVDKDNNGQFYDKNTIIYGHRMKSGSMFGKLEKYAKKEFYEKYPYFYIYTPDGKESKYEVLSAAVVKATSDSYQRSFSTPDEFMEYIRKAKANSIYETKAEATEKSQIVTLSTCTVDSNEDRFIVQAVKVSER